MSRDTNKIDSKETRGLNNIENVVLLSFLRAIKDRNMLSLYTRMLNHNSFMKQIMSIFPQKTAIIMQPEFPFSNCKDNDNIIQVLKSINSKRVGGNYGDKYDYVTMTINHLLHFFLESNLDMSKLSEIGEEIYEKSCNILFGDSYEDIQLQKETASKLESAEAIEQQIYDRYINSLENGRISPNISFRQFIESEMAHLKQSNICNLFDDALLNNGGIMLGDVPDFNSI